MEDKVYKNNFEQFLKDTTEDFLMIPSRKVWYSLYNDMHPDRKWPSMAVCMLILSAVLYIGVSNNNSLSDAARRASLENLSDFARNYTAEKDAVTAGIARSNSQAISQHYYSHITSENKNFVSIPDNSALFSNLLNSEKKSGSEYDLQKADESLYATVAGSNTKDQSTSSSSRLLAEAVSKADLSTGGTDKNLQRASINKAAVTPEDFVSPVEEDQILSASPVINAVKKMVSAEATNLKAVADHEKAWREDFAFRNQPRNNKFSQHTRITYFFTPSIGYRDFTKNRESILPPPVISPSFSNAAAVAAIAEPLKDGKALNLELGAVLNYSLTDNLSLKSGLQVNYTNFISHVTALGHPTQVVLADSKVNTMRSSDYSATAGVDRLNKSSLQISMPVGADIKIAGNHKIKWYAGAAIQPTYIFSGAGYVLSADGKNYISDRSLLRKFNMNTAVETFLSFKSSAGVTLKVGPQFRYQLLSSYKKDYNYTEKLYNLGIKIGIATPL